MKKMLALAAVAAIFASPAHAVVVLSGTGTLEATDSKTTDRLLRNGVASTWASVKAFPGTFGSNSQFVYDLVSPTFAANAFQDIFYRISLTNTSANIGQPHGIAYANAFDPANFATNYLGDSGASPNPTFTTSYQVVVAAGSSLLLHFGATSQTLPSTYSYSVEAFSDANGGEVFASPPGAVPEPATWGMLLLGFFGIGTAIRRAKRQGLRAALA